MDNLVEDSEIGGVLKEYMSKEKVRTIMVDRTPEATHKIMSAVKQKDAEPELLLRRKLWSSGSRYRKDHKKLSGKPDIVFIGKKVAVSVMEITGMDITGRYEDMVPLSKSFLDTRIFFARKY